MYISSHEYKQICAWVLKFRNSETGGDLFGLWSDKRSAVVHFVLGPGRECQRGTHSFYQDVSYLENVGSYLTHSEGLCHIGEWHSHHVIGLKRPSGGDKQTVWSNMPTYGLSRFLLFIANIEPSTHEVSIGCFLFEFSPETNRKQLPPLPGKFVLLPSESPFRSRCQHSEVQLPHQLITPSCFEDEAESLNTATEISHLEVKTPAKQERPIVEDRKSKSAANEKLANKAFAQEEEGKPNSVGVGADPESDEVEPKHYKSMRTACTCTVY